MESHSRFGRCFNPYNIKYHLIKKGVRLVTQDVEKALGIKGSYYLCTKCRMKAKSVIANKPVNIKNDITDSDIFNNDGEHNVNFEDHDKINLLEMCPLGDNEELLSQQTIAPQVDVEIELPTINKAMNLLKQSPIQSKRLYSTYYLRHKVDKAYHYLKSTLKITGSNQSICESYSEDLKNLIGRLKEKFHDKNTIRSEKIQILTLLPNEWSLKKVCKIMDATEYMVSVSKRLSVSKGKPLHDSLVLKIKTFYKNDEISSNMPGLKDYVSIRSEDGIRNHVQKRLILSNLSELYQCYRKQYPEDKIGFSKFASLRPQHCVLAGASGTHTVCVCAVHQNIKLMIFGASLKLLTKTLSQSLNHYTDCLNMILCDFPSSKCYFGKCSKCPGTNTLCDFLINIFENNAIENITYKHWVSDPRATLETTVKSSYDFAQHFCDKLKAMLPHSYIAKEQSSFLKSLKESLKMDELIVICDFAENYAFVVQNAAAGFHWNNNQATVFPTVIYYKNSGELTHRSIVIISDCNNHDSIAVHVYLQIITDFLKTIRTSISKIYYFSDGAPQQFKNFANIYFHKMDFGISAEWHYFATAHGKGPCDGIGGTLKRMAARTSLQLPIDQQILTPFELYEWASKLVNLPNITIKFSSVKNYYNAAEKLKSRYSSIKPIIGTQKLHCIIPTENGTLIVKDFSTSSESKICKLFKRVTKYN
ncbi:uncharacterized protein [Prorops nasuta]|uniref:uncharacterized protein n=1 Tax=Prorops nasuta TaxID=863751 RepID=UPI0034CEFADF